MYKCVVATTEHLEWIRDVAATRMLVEELYKPQYVNKDKITHLIEAGLSTNTVWIVLKNDSPVGALGALCVPNMFNPNITCLVEVFWWVSPEHRSGRAGLLLLNAFLSKSDKYDESTMSLLTTSVVMNETLLKRGFELREFGFHKERM